MKETFVLVVTLLCLGDKYPFIILFIMQAVIH